MNLKIKQRSKKFCRIFVILIILISMFGVNVMADEEKNELEIELSEAKIQSVMSDDEKNIPELEVVKFDETNIIESGYKQIFEKGLQVSNGSNDRILVRVELDVEEDVDAVLGVNYEEEYIEYLPFNYDKENTKLSLTAENGTVIIPLSYSEEIEGISQSNLVKSMEVEADNEFNFNIISNYNGIVNIDISSLYVSGNYYYKIYNDDDLVKDNTSLTNQTIQEKLYKRGVYRFEIYKKNSFWFDTKLWEQEVYVEPNPLSENIKNKLDEVANEYAPILTMTEEEVYRPIKLYDILDNPNYEIALNTKEGTEKLALPVLRDYMRYNGYSKALLEGHWGLGTVSDSLKDLPISMYETQVYYTYMEIEDGYIINYHFFYNFDPKTALGSVSAHNMDREQLSITFDKTTFEPEYIYYPQHLLTSKMELRSDSGDIVNNIMTNSSSELKSSWTGYVKLHFDDAKLNNLVIDDTHLIIAIAEGGHAPFPLSAMYKYGLFDEPAGITGNDINSESFFVPKELYDKKPDSSEFTTENIYNLSLLPIDEIVSGDSVVEDINLLAFSGYWVDLVGLNNEKFPPFIDIMRNPEGYISESIKEESHTFTFENIPDSIIARNNEIKGYLDDNLIKY